MLCGNDEIGVATAEKLKEFRLCVWGMHGIFGTGRSLDEAFGLVETVEKAAEIYVKIMNKPILQTITDEQLWILATRSASPRERASSSRENKKGHFKFKRGNRR